MLNTGWDVILGHLVVEPVHRPWCYCRRLVSTDRCVVLLISHFVRYVVTQIRVKCVQ